MKTGLNLYATAGLRGPFGSSALATQTLLETSELAASLEHPPLTAISFLIHLLFYNVSKRTFYITDFQAHHKLFHASK